MSICDTGLIFFVLFLSPLRTTSFNNSLLLRPDSPRKVQIKRSYANLLNSLIKVNEERVLALKKLYVLNSITYGKDVLRSNIEHQLEDYDKMQGMLIKTLRDILDSLGASKTSNDDYDLNEIIQNYDPEILSLSIDEDKKKRKVLRNEDSDNNSRGESDAKDSSKSTSLERLNDEELNEAKGNGTADRSFYTYGCGRGRVRCIKACKESYRYACDYYYCKSGLRRTLKSACKSECRSWFY